MKPRLTSIDRLLSAMAVRDVCVVFPTLRHAAYWKPRLADLVRERHQERAGIDHDVVHVAHTSITSRVTHTTMRIWVPYSPEPTQPMDYARNRRGFEFHSFYPMEVNA